MKDPLQRELWAHTLMEKGGTGVEEDEEGLSAYFIASEEEILDEVHSLLSKEGVEYRSERIPDQDWNKKWEDSFHPVRIGKELLIRAPFHPQEEGFRYRIELEPRRAFGTGHHPTTLLMLERILSLVEEGDEVLDMGSGTGILSILCEKMGARRILAIDNEEWAVRNCKDALERNACERVRVKRDELLPWKEDAFDVILGNIERNVLLKMLPSFVPLLKAEGVLLLSGLKLEDQEIMDAKAEEVGLQRSDRKTGSEWIMLEYRKK